MNSAQKKLTKREQGKDRLISVYSLALALSYIPEDIRKDPWTARREKLVCAELRALQTGDEKAANEFAALRDAHESLCTGLRGTGPAVK